MLIFLVLIVHLFDIQILQHSDLKKIAENRSSFNTTVKGSRGVILDRNFNLLTQNISRYTFWVNTQSPLENEDEIISLFADTFGKDESFYRNLLVPGKKYIPLARDILEPNCMRILKAMPIKGLNQDNSVERYYPYPEIVSQVIGFTQANGKGVIGMESALESFLAGNETQQIFQRDGRGTLTSSLYKELPSLQNGANLQLTIDIELQSILYDELSRAQEKTEAASANGVILDPFTGEVLAMATVPGFNLNQYQDYPLGNQVNDVISTCYEPGSTFKIVALAAALDSGMITPWKMYFCENGTYNLPNRVLHDHKQHGYLTVAEILSNSSNIGMSKIASDIGPALIYKYARNFGFGIPTGISLPYESPGCLKPYSEWTDYSAASVAMGQEMSATTLQMAMAYCVIANGGYLLKPHVIRNRYYSDGTTEEIVPAVIRQVIKKQTAEEIMTMLVDVVNSGTGTNAQIPGYLVGGKTGTAQKFIDGKYSDREYTSSFAGIFPANAPQYVCVVTVDCPKYGYHWGNATAAPVVRKVFERIINMGTDKLVPFIPEQDLAEFTDHALTVEHLTSLAEAR
ncbi:MAG: penicillin-binding protein 2 [FCB group bacterium]|nr:penicillin-binding protein 2 [FCB group bacterium]